MELPLRLADAVAGLVQRAPGSPRIPTDIAFAEVPAHTHEVTVPTRLGPVAATVYTPEGGAAGAGVHVNLHGGGFVLGHPEQDDPLCRYLAAHAGVTVLNVDYGTAPQLRFPGAVAQAHDVAVWAASPDRPWDGSRLVVGGQSAGGALAAGVSRLALEEGGPDISLQVLMYPPLDLTVPSGAKKAPGTEALLVWMGPVFDRVYCPDPRRRRHRLASPASDWDTASLAGIAPGLVVTAQRDILRAEGTRYAARLEEADALVAHVDVDGVGHGFNILGAPRSVVQPVYDRIVEETCRALA